MNNRALVFVKPHAITAEFISFVESFLSEKGISLSEPRRIDAAEIKKMEIVDRHYFAIAQSAVFTPPKDYSLGEGAKRFFAEAFGTSWDEAVAAGEVLNSAEAQKRLGKISGIELNEIWQRAPQSKLAPGLYAARFEEAGFYCINGFYPAQREVFTAPGAEVQLYEAEFSPRDLSWQEFRQELIGATDPEKAAVGSLRRRLLESFGAFGLSSKPNVSINGIHASAGPLEGLRERSVWLDIDVFDDPFVKSLLDGGMDEAGLRKLLENPTITTGSETGPAFDLTEDTDSQEAAEKLLRWWGMKN
ncbi:MAG TPA: hypothetical protein ENN41_07135 [Sediminispirochaeta sp.]|nr:hypothetical protein [Sediminispirochaeta sp.]